MQVVDIFSVNKIADKRIDKNFPHNIDKSPTMRFLTPIPFSDKKRKTTFFDLMESLFSFLQDSVEGEVFNDPITMRIYSVDASLFEVEPKLVVQPRTTSDIRMCITTARENNCAIIPRGAATGIAGGCVGEGMVLDLSRHFTKIGPINWEQESIDCEAGAVCDAINDYLRPHGYRLGPEISTSNRATIGGMAATNSAGAQSLRYGAMADHVLALDMVLSSGEVVQLGQESKGNLEQTLLAQAKDICSRYQSELKEKIPKLSRKASGYLLERLLPSPTNLCPAVVGSEGTLGVITRLTMKIVPLVQNVVLCLLAIPNLLQAAAWIDTILQCNPLSFEYVDSHIVEGGLLSRSLRRSLSWFTPNAGGFFLIEIDTDEAEKTLRAFAKERGWRCEVLLDPKKQEAVRRLRKEGLGLLLSKRSYTRAVSFIEDVALPPQKLASFLPHFQKLFAKHGVELGLYGHIGPGCLHARPYLNLRKKTDVETMRLLFSEVGSLLQEYNGVFSGEHGDGRIRSWTHESAFGKKILQAFREWKELFDPFYLMNPGKIVDPVDPYAQWRLSPKTQQKEIKTFLDFSAEGGLALSVDLCNGNGQCRKKTGVMCPSFQVTGNERDTTRARAQILRGIISGRIPEEDLSHPGLKEVLDLCIGCKGCRKECPSHVDMAKMKAEASYQHAEKYGRKTRDVLFGFFSDLLSWAALFPPFANRLQESEVGQWVKRQVGISIEHPFPKLTKQPFSRQRQKKNATIVLFSDTYTQFFYPHLGEGAIRILEEAKEQVHVPPWACCGRPLLSKGFLPQAKQKAKKVIRQLYPYAVQGKPIVVLEPSCLWTMKEDLHALFSSQEPEKKQLETVAKSLVSLEQVLLEKKSFALMPAQKVLFHGHCYEKTSSKGTEPMHEYLIKVAKEVSEIPSGCCGMAGSFGYEEEHRLFSLSIGELSLFPAIRSASEEVAVLANGFSCRAQISFGTGRKALHLVEWIDLMRREQK